MTSESKRNDSKCIQDPKEPFRVAIWFNTIIRNAIEPSLSDGYAPHDGAVSDGCDGSHQRNSGDGVEIGELGEENRRAGENKVPLHGG